MSTQRTWHEKHKDDLTFGQRAADVLRNGMTIRANNDRTPREKSMPWE